jgi:hypothetical protein
MKRPYRRIHCDDCPPDILAPFAHDAAPFSLKEIASRSHVPMPIHDAIKLAAGSSLLIPHRNAIVRTPAHSKVREIARDHLKTVPFARPTLTVVSCQSLARFCLFCLGHTRDWLAVFRHNCRFSIYRF